MEYKITLFAILVICTQVCDGSLIEGILNSAHQATGAVLGGFSQGFNLNFGGQVGFHDRGRPQRPHLLPHHEERPGKSDETVVVIIEDKEKHGHHRPHHHNGYGSQGQYQHRPGYNPSQMQGNYGNQNPGFNQNENWTGNQGHQNIHGHPEYHGNHDQSGSYGNHYQNQGNNGNQNGNWAGNGQYGNKPNHQHESSNNQGHYGQGGEFGQKPGQHQNNNWNDNNQHGYGNQNKYNNPNHTPSEKPPQRGYGDEGHAHNEPTSSHQDKPEQSNVPNKPQIDKNKPYSDGEKSELATKQPSEVDDYPLFIPLNPNQHGSDKKSEVNAPKRDTTNSQPSSSNDEDEDLQIDIRIDNK